MKLWQAIQRTQLSHSQVNDDEMPEATAEQAPKPQHAAQTTAHVARHAEPRASRHTQIEDVAKWLAVMGRQANWMSDELVAGVDATKMRAMWKEYIDNSDNTPKETDRFNARKHRLVALFGSKDCYSANVHSDTNDLKELVDSLVRLDRLPDETPPEGLKLLVQAWDENRGKYEEWSPQHGLTGHRGLLWREPRLYIQPSY